MQDDELSLLRRQQREGSITLEQLAAAEKRTGRHFQTLERMLATGTPMRKILREYPEYARTHGEKYYTSLRAAIGNAFPRPNSFDAHHTPLALAFGNPAETEKIVPTLPLITQRNRFRAALSLAYQTIDPDKSLRFLKQIKGRGRVEATCDYAVRLATHDLDRAEAFITTHMSRRKGEPKRYNLKKIREDILRETGLDNPDYALKQSKKNLYLQRRFAFQAVKNPDLALRFLGDQPSEELDLFRHALSYDLALAQTYLAHITTRHPENRTRALALVSRSTTPYEQDLLTHGRTQQITLPQEDINHVMEELIRNHQQGVSPDWFERNAAHADRIMTFADIYLLNNQTKDHLRRIMAPRLLEIGQRETAEKHAALINGPAPNFTLRYAYTEMILMLNCTR